MRSPTNRLNRNLPPGRGDKRPHQSNMVLPMETDLDDEGLDSDKRLDDLANHSLESYRRMGGNQGDTWLRGVNHGLMYVMTIKISDVPCLEASNFIVIGAPHDIGQLTIIV